MTTTVSFEIAKLLKEKGFNLYSVLSYWKNELTHHTPGYALEDGTTSQENYWGYERYYAPTIAEVCMWLYEKHGIWVYAKLGYGHEYVIQSTQSPFSFIYSDGTYSSPTEAYSEAILYTLKNLIK